jgi:hypothetical protein
MKKLLTITAVLAASLPLFAQTLPLYVTGDFNGWNAAGNVMTETSLGSGIWQVTLNMSAGRHEFKVTEGDWSWNVPGANSWLYTDGSGNVTVTYDSNTYADGWSSASGRIGVSVDPGTWTAVGDWQGWNNADLATVMTGLGGGIYELQYTIGLAGTYQYKAVDTGSWDAIGSDARSINAGNLGFTTTSANQLVDFYVNALNGTIKVDVVPEPSTVAMSLSGLAALLVFRRRAK